MTRLSHAALHAKACADPRATRIAQLNDRCRQAWGAYRNSRVVMTQGIAGLDDATRSKVCEAVQTFDAFTYDNDPHGEHDCATIEINPHVRVIWKFDYYDLALEWGSEDPTDPTKTVRVLTIMLASEY